ncbi:MAG: hypothetical protein U1E22_07850 [Coriobacteriia bacterium]|nr:hypothetical protein [Coriobacteriia bacterium]
MHIMMIAHVGETVGHVARGLAIADALRNRGTKVEFAVDPRAQWLFDVWPSSYRTYPISWDFSHNAFGRDSAPQQVLRGVLKANRELLAVLKETQPDAALGLPGLFSFQACRSLGIPHASVMHAPYLSPLLDLHDASQAERIVLDLTNEILLGGAVDTVLNELSAKLALPAATMREALAEETIICPQPGLPFRGPCPQNIQVADFIAASYGPSPPPGLSTGSDLCYVTFGSGNPCDLGNVVRSVAGLYDQVLLSTGSLRVGDMPKNVITCRAVSAEGLLDRVSAVVSHGGIGTVGTFARAGIPQLVIPTEPDQATMAVHGTRHGVCMQCGLEAWSEHAQTGRRLPQMGVSELHDAILQMRDAEAASWNRFPACGASNVAGIVMNGEQPAALAS